MTSATDIITYIGVPLAVLGVLPILYTFVLSILTQRRIRSLLLSHGHRPQSNTRRANQEGFVLRASPMTSLMEVEMPRYTIAPVDRDDERYWELDRSEATAHLHPHLHAALAHAAGEEGHHRNHLVERVESTLSMLEEGRVRGYLRGGSWRTFHWRRLVVGRKMYRIQYEDELREPPAEIEFTDLVNFLVDRGAELDGMGWEKLRSGGLWTPAGTVLLRVGAAGQDGVVDIEDPKGESCASSTVGRSHNRDGGSGDWVLRTSMPDDSDGILTLCVRWPQDKELDSSARSVTSLPPGWGRLRKPVMVINHDQDEGTLSDDNKNNLASSISKLVESSKSPLQDLPSLRFKLDLGHINTVYTESFSYAPTGDCVTLYPLSDSQHHPSGSHWFTAALSSLLTLTKHSNSAAISTGSPWGFTLSPSTSTFLQKDTFPVGILVLLSILSPDRAPDWDFSSAHSENEAVEFGRAHHQRFQARLAAERVEASMPADQARVHKANREMAERRQISEEMLQNLSRRREREERRVNDAIVSPRVSVQVVGDAALEWLVENKVVARGVTVEKVVEGVCYLLILQTLAISKETTRTGGSENDDKEKKLPTTIPVLRILEEWVNWSVAGGMKREHLDMLETHKTEFCYAACVVAVVNKAASMSTGKGQASLDMLECLKMWKKVRLG